MKAVVAAFNQEKALVGAFSVITNLRMELFEALTARPRHVTPLTASLIHISSFCIMQIENARDVHWDTLVLPSSN